MFKLPSQAYVHREFPVKDVYKAIGAGKDLRGKSRNIKKLFVDYVFNGKTTNLRSEAIKEIYFYRLELTDYSIPEDFIVELDRKTKFQTVFVLTCNEMEIVRTAPKVIQGEKVGKTKYVSSEWRKASDDVELPSANSLDEFYCFIYGSFNKYKPFPGENIEEYIRRSNELKSLDYQIEKTTQAIQFEKQNKKRLEYNHRLNEYKQRKAFLTDQRRIENGKLEDEIAEYCRTACGED